MILYDISAHNVCLRSVSFICSVQARNSFTFTCIVTFTLESVYVLAYPLQLVQLGLVCERLASILRVCNTKAEIYTPTCSCENIST